MGITKEWILENYPEKEEEDDFKFLHGFDIEGLDEEMLEHELCPCKSKKGKKKGGKNEK